MKYDKSATCEHISTALWDTLHEIKSVEIIIIIIIIQEQYTTWVQEQHL